MLAGQKVQLRYSHADDRELLSQARKWSKLKMHEVEDLAESIKRLTLNGAVQCRITVRASPGFLTTASIILLALALPWPAMRVISLGIRTVPVLSVAKKLAAPRPTPTAPAAKCGLFRQDEAD